VFKIWWYHYRLEHWL